MERRGSRSGGTADASAKVGCWSGALVLELLGVVPFLCALPPMFHQLMHSTLLHGLAPGAVVTSVGHSEFVPAAAIIPFMVYQLAGFGTLHFVVSKPVNWLINIGIFVLIVATYAANRLNQFEIELTLGAALVLSMTALVLYGVLKLRQMQTLYDAHRPAKVGKHAKEAMEATASAPAAAD